MKKEGAGQLRWASKCKTRGQDGFADLLSCRALASPTTYRLIPAHPQLDVNSIPSWTSEGWLAPMLVNGGNASIFVKAFDLSTASDDRALLHDVFEGEPCRQALNSVNRNDNPGGALRIGYSRLHTSSILEIHGGNSLEFSVPVDHLSADRCVRVGYWTEIARVPVSQDGYRFLWLGPLP